MCEIGSLSPHAAPMDEWSKNVSNWGKSVKKILLWKKNKAGHYFFCMCSVYWVTQLCWLGRLYTRKGQVSILLKRIKLAEESSINLDKCTSK